MIANKISLDLAKPEKLFYFVAGAVVYRHSDQRCLILKRSEREIAHPGKFGVCGGKLEWKDIPIDKPGHINGEVLDYPEAITNLIIREVREEAGVEVKLPLHYLYSMAYVRPDGVPVVFIKFAVEYASGEVKLEEDGFSDYAWVNHDEVGQYPCMDGIDREVRSAIEIFGLPDRQK